jgi:hypothetical protein
MEGGAATALLIGSTPRCWPGDHLVVSDDALDATDSPC